MHFGTMITDHGAPEFSLFMFQRIGPTQSPETGLGLGLYEPSSLGVTHKKHVRYISARNTAQKMVI